MIRLVDEKEIKPLRDYFEREESVPLAFLFGSYAKGAEMEESDFDVAVYLKEYRSSVEDKIWFDISNIIKKEVDLVVLNEAPASLVSLVFKTNLPLTIKDKRLYWELYLRSSSETEDFLEFVEDFWRIKQKARSLDEEGRIRVRVRIDYLETEVKELERFKKISYKEYLEDRDKRKLIERWAENILNATIDIAKIILASEKKRLPRSYEEALFDFAFFVGFDEEESKRFSRFAYLRNILAHEYLEVLYGRLKDFIQEFPRFYRRILTFLEDYL